MHGRSPSGGYWRDPAARPDGEARSRAAPATARSWWGTMTSAASSGLRRGYSALVTATASAPPVTWAAMNAGAEEGAMPAKVSENIRPTVIAGLAKLVEEVKK